MTQYGFLFDQSRCIGCNTCLLACKQWHNVAPGPTKWMRVYQWEKGVFPNVRLHHLAIPCYHCENPVCLKACPTRAIYKEERYGAVLVSSERCKGNRKCWAACPYGAPQFEGDGPGVKMSKCNMCLERLEKGRKPICVLSCPMRALEFGPIVELTKRYGNLKRLEDMPKDSITGPSVVFIPPEPKRQVVPWDAARALQLWQRKQPIGGENLPDAHVDVSGVTAANQDITGRNHLVLKSKNVAELMYFTEDDE